jgi:hypothetical protein
LNLEPPYKAISLQIEEQLPALGIPKFKLYWYDQIFNSFIRMRHPRFMTQSESKNIRRRICRHISKEVEEYVVDHKYLEESR